MTGPWYYNDLLRAGRLLNVYQPIVDLESNRTMGFELLTRLIAEDGRIIPPDEFLPKLRRASLERLLFDSLAQTRRELGADLAGYSISINLGRDLLLRRNFLRKLQSATAGLAAKRVALELLETEQFLSLDAAAEQISRLREAGFLVAIDDLGAGNSSLGRLNQLKVDVVKLDKEFAVNLRRRPESLHVIASMIYLARGLRAFLVVEGVETPEIAAALRVLGVRYAQGYGIARPMPAAQFITWLAASRTAPAASRTPNSMLGCYAAHIGLVDAYRSVLDQPLNLTFGRDIADPHACPIGRFFDQHGLHEQEVGLAHKCFHRKLACYAEDTPGWEAAAAALDFGLQRAIHAEAASQPERAARATAEAAA